MFSFLLLVCFLSGSMGSEVLSRQKRAWIIDSFEIEEEHPGPFPLVLGKIHVYRDYRVIFELSGEGVDEEPKGLISIDPDSGILRMHGPIDYEEKTLLQLKFEAKTIDQTTDTKIGVEVQIRDINDNPPRFQMDVYEVSVKAETPQGSLLLTVLALDRDKIGTLNSTFHYQIKSVSPNIPQTQFIIDEHGVMSFKGCLNHEAAEKFTILVEAQDHGNVVRLSSSTTVIIHIQDNNHHRPIISGITGSSRVKEGVMGSSPLRLHVTDKDTPNTPGWRTKYTLHGDEGQHFRIETDPRTNDGVLTVIKPLDFEEGSQQKLSISVENESPYFSCNVKEKSSSGLWKVDISRDQESDARRSLSVEVTVEVEDVNDPPLFRVSHKKAFLEENSPVGTWVEKMTAVDPDAKEEGGVIYKVGYDPAGWMTVDPKTGDITTVKIPDRESPHVEKSIYTFLLHAVDKGEPPMTATATVHVHVKDQNDHVPQLAVDHVSMCVSDTTTVTNITAYDADAYPFGGPFKFELLGADEEKWTLDPSYGFTYAGLLKSPSVYAGLHVIRMKIYDIQGEFGVYHLNVTVCDCSVTRDCGIHRTTVTRAGPAAIAIAVGSLLLVLVLLLAAVFVSCKKVFTDLETVDGSGQSFMTSNIEKPGTDCKVTRRLEIVIETHEDPSQQQKDLKDHRYENSYNQKFHPTWGGGPHFNTPEFEKGNPRHKLSSGAMDATLRALLGKRLNSLQVPEHELMDYSPHLYAVEGSSSSLVDLGNIQYLDVL